MYFHSVFSWHKCSSHVFYVFRRPTSLVSIIFTFAIRYIKWTRKRSVIRTFKAKHLLRPSQYCRRQVHWWAPLGNRAGAFYIPSPGSGHELLHSLGPDVDEDGYWIWYFTWNIMMMMRIRVAGVGKLSASAKNAFNSFVGRVFANSRQKTSFFAYLLIRDKKTSFFA